MREKVEVLSQVCEKFGDKKRHCRRGRLNDFKGLAFVTAWHTGCNGRRIGWGGWNGREKIARRTARDSARQSERSSYKLLDGACPTLPARGVPHAGYA